MPTHPYYVALEKELFARLAVVRERARVHKMTIRTHGKDTQPKRFTLKRRGAPTRSCGPPTIRCARSNASWISSMAAADCYDQVLRCPCGSAVTLHWVDRCYLTADPELERVTGPAIRRRPKAPVIITKDHTDVLGARCGSVLHASEVTGKAKRAAAATACRQRS